MISLIVHIRNKAKFLYDFCIHSKRIFLLPKDAFLSINTSCLLRNNNHLQIFLIRSTIGKLISNVVKTAFYTRQNFKKFESFVPIRNKQTFQVFNYRIDRVTRLSITVTIKHFLSPIKFHHNFQPDTTILWGGKKTLFHPKQPKLHRLKSPSEFHPRRPYSTIEIFDS